MRYIHIWNLITIKFYLTTNSPPQGGEVGTSVITYEMEVCKMSSVFKTTLQFFTIYDHLAAICGLQ